MLSAKAFTGVFNLNLSIAHQVANVLVAFPNRRNMHSRTLFSATLLTLFGILQSCHALSNHVNINPLAREAGGINGRFPNMARRDLDPSSSDPLATDSFPPLLFDETNQDDDDTDAGDNDDSGGVDYADPSGTNTSTVPSSPEVVEVPPSTTGMLGTVRSFIVRAARPCGKAPKGVPQHVFNDCCAALITTRAVISVEAEVKPRKVRLRGVPYPCISVSPWYDGLDNNVIAPHACGDDCLEWSGKKLTKKRYRVLKEAFEAVKH